MIFAGFVLGGARFRCPRAEAGSRSPEAAHDGSFASARRRFLLSGIERPRPTQARQAWRVGCALLRLAGK
jgi:hypothetical protein